MRRGGVPAKSGSYWGHSLPTPSETHEENEQGGMSLLEQIVLEERRALARAAGTSVARIEEEANLQSALSQSIEAEDIESVGLVPLLSTEEIDDNEDEDEDDHVSSRVVNTVRKSQSSTNASALNLGSFARIPDETIGRSLCFLTPETIFFTASISRDWSRIINKEELSQLLCRRAYGARTRIFRPEKWEGGWRGMLSNRPRPRVGGIYALRESRWRKVSQQDMFLPQDLKGIFHIEIVWWRLFRFFDDGSFLYALINGDHIHTTIDKGISASLAQQKADHRAAIQTAVNIFNKKASSDQHHRQASPLSPHFGQYTLNKHAVLNTKLSLPHALIHFDFYLEHAAPGRFNRLRLFTHSQYDTNGQFPIHHDLPAPDQIFSFFKVDAWS